MLLDGGLAVKGLCSQVKLEPLRMCPTDLSLWMMCGEPGGGSNLLSKLEPVVPFLLLLGLSASC